MTERLEAQTLEAHLESVFIAAGDEVASVPVDRLMLTYAGIPGDRHAGTTRLSGAREPWYARGTPMRNERQLSILSTEELVDVAAAMAIPELKPEWIGASLLLSGIHDMSRLPPRSILMFPSGAAVRIDGDNGPCRDSGRSIVAATGQAEHEFSFVKAAKGKRGLVGWVEREGVITPGDSIKIRVWAQELYRP
jgi:hypothetical protein